MLAQNFKTAGDLGINEPQLSALQKTLVLLETGRLTHAPRSEKMLGKSATFTGHFNMSGWAREGECGTVCCIGGTARLIGQVEFPYYGRSKKLNDLFYPNHRIDMSAITVEQAATALRSYLTTGDARWDLAVS